MRGTETVTVRRLEPDDWALSRDIRLAALADAPHAYGSSLAREREFTEDVWRSRLRPENGVTVLATVGDRAAGIAGGYTPADADSVLLVAMWARPELRGRGVADALVTEIFAWAAENGWSEVRLRVADGNTAARKLFERHGFRSTGERDTLESDPSVYTETLSREV
jgi:ribosomal protein S18 acetylase RimI-like enzyme